MNLSTTIWLINAIPLTLIIGAGVFFWFQVRRLRRRGHFDRAAPILLAVWIGGATFRLIMVTFWPHGPFWLCFALPIGVATVIPFGFLAHRAYRNPENFFAPRTLARARAIRARLTR